ncbi:hypothetical protein M2139_001550 [Enterococcus sp. PF1-24]|uniref:hypothetical protein n=1 Tax=unclassified Enterococcus TaxID=2608891 RepID=UPI002473C0D7|nr:MULTISPECIES: hypothetical protein [unclassified Enterococcus]MDH6364563.1 hypothetical protein [Enterococcus sp. PFB1-1]MDH6401664.1 hypothetical protein [Enterococcus sp. PF1-24]
MKKSLFYVGAALTLGGGLFLSQQADAATAYRLYNPNSSEHFYTEKDAERNQLFDLGWHYEDLAWTTPEKGAAVYRLYNPNSGDHHYTTDKGEADGLVKHGWLQEETAWYSAESKAVPIYRAYNPNAKTGSHHYTASQAEIKELVALGWKEEGIGWYAEVSEISKNVIPEELRGNFIGTGVVENEKVTHPVAITANSVLYGGHLYSVYEAKQTDTQIELFWDHIDSDEKDPDAHRNVPFVFKKDKNHYELQLGLISVIIK